jgi:hypothetical protein
MALAPAQLKLLRDTLVDAFPSPESIAELVRFTLGESLTNITTTSGLNAIVFALIEWAIAHERLRDLIDGAAEERPNNEILRDLKWECGRREYELGYLQEIRKAHEASHMFYTELSATAQLATAQGTEPKGPVKSDAAARHLEMELRIFKKTYHDEDDERAQITKVESFEEARKGILELRRVALIGDPGAGKSTTLARLAYEFANAALQAEDRALPLLVPLAAYRGDDFDRFLQEHFDDLPLHRYMPSRVAFMLDGLNEMAPEYVPNIEEWIRIHPNIFVIVSCRKLDYIQRKLPLQRVDVAPLDVRRIFQFIGNYLKDDHRDRLFWGLCEPKIQQAWKWHKSVLPHASIETFWYGKTYLGPGWQQPEKVTMDAVQALVRETDKQPRTLPGMLGVVSNPYLLTIVLAIYSSTQQGKLPANRAQLFDEFIHQLMKERGKPMSKVRPPWIDEEIQRNALAVLAYRIQIAERGTSMDVARAREIVEQAAPGHNAEQILYLAASASILDYGSTTVRFTHQLLQEYFAAFKMRDDVYSNVSASKFWPDEQWWQPTGWEESAIVLAGMEGDSTAVVRWLTPVHPILAYRAATESGASCDEAALHALREPTPGVRLAPIARAEWWRTPEKQMDLGPGVGVRADGLPEIAWCEIPHGEFVYQYGSLIWIPAFTIAKFPVTYAQFKAFLDAHDGFANAAWWEGLAFREESPPNQNFPYMNHPADNVSWYDAVAFCRWLSSKLGEEISLPREMQWEKAARGTDGRRFPWGDEYIPGYANIDELDEHEPVGPSYLQSTTAVGLYPWGASPYGVMDMCGNVFNWCLDTDSFSPRRDLSGDAKRILRGGSWNNNVHVAWTGNYYSQRPNVRNWRIGFRPVRVLK